jgi:hypothetical protein
MVFTHIIDPTVMKNQRSREAFLDTCSCIRLMVCLDLISLTGALGWAKGVSIDAMMYGSFGLALATTYLQGCRKCQVLSGAGLALCRMKL